MAQAKKTVTINTLEVVFPQDTNHYGPLFGGTLLSWIDKVGFYAVARFCGSPAVTVAIEGIDFSVPLMVGDQVELIAQIIHTGRTSMVVRVQVFRTDMYGHDKAVLATTGYLTYVSIDENRKPLPVPALLIETDDERALFALGAQMREQALARVKATGK